MNIVKFFRIHHKDDIFTGCYRRNNSFNNLSIVDLDGFYGDLEKHPAPQDDSKLDDVLWANDIDFRAYHFGFTSINQFKAWFYNDEWLEWLDIQGYVLSEFDCYNVPSCFIAGNAQAIAKLAEAHHVVSYKIDIYLMHKYNVTKL